MVIVSVPLAVSTTLLIWIIRYKKSSPDIVEEDWNKSIQMASKAGQHLEFIHFFALCHVIKRPIILYASDDDMRD